MQVKLAGIHYQFTTRKVPSDRQARVCIEGPVTHYSIIKDEVVSVLARYSLASPNGADEKTDAKRLTPQN